MLALFSQARDDFPESLSLAAFEALTLHAAGRVDTAFGSLLTLLADQVPSEELDRYRPTLRSNADELTGNGLTGNELTGNGLAANGLAAND